MADLYAKGCVSDSDKDWFHGELTKEEAEEALAQSDGCCFLIRGSKRYLVLSLSQDGETYHFRIEYGPGWYKLKEGKKSFSDLQELVSYYQGNPIVGDKTLNVACQKMSHSLVSTIDPG